MRFREKLCITRKALAQTNTLGIGEIAFSGREHLVAIGAPINRRQKGLMLYTLRYEDELRDANSTFEGTKGASVEADELSLAKQIINGSTSALDLSKYKDDYEVAVEKMVEAKRKGKPIVKEEAEAPRPKVVNIMEALRGSLSDAKTGHATKKKSQRKRAA